MTTIANATSTASPPPEIGSPPFEHLYACHSDCVFRFCLSQVNSHANAEDLTQETFLRALRAYDRAPLDPPSARSWLLAIARNLTIDHHRRQARWRRLLATTRAEPTGRGPDLELEVMDRSELRRVTSAAQALRSRDRQLVGLRVAAELSYREVGELLGIPEQVAKVATFRALARLRHRMETTS